jgi:hypothetical protein
MTQLIKWPWLSGAIQLGAKKKPKIYTYLISFAVWKISSSYVKHQFCWVGRGWVRPLLVLVDLEDLVGDVLDKRETFSR